MSNDIFLIDKENLQKFTNLEENGEERLNYLKSLGGLDALYNKLRLNSATGLSTSNQIDLNARREKFGSNEKQIRKSKSFFHYFLAAFSENFFFYIIKK
jgi:hypothetical protein